MNNFQITDANEETLKLGMAALNANKLGCAHSFFLLAKKEGHPEAEEFINLVREIELHRTIGGSNERQSLCSL